MITDLFSFTIWTYSSICWCDLEIF